MQQPSTCGQGLASRSDLPLKLGDLLSAQARILEAHVRALDPEHMDARHELDAYAALVVAHRDVADRLTGIADQMAGYRNLPMAAHDEEVMSDALTHNTFEDFVRHERALTTVLQQRLEEDQQMLERMAG